MFLEKDTMRQKRTFGVGSNIATNRILATSEHEQKLAKHDGLYNVHVSCLALGALLPT